MGERFAVLMWALPSHLTHFRLFFVQTKQAWYILTDPSDDYRDLYLDEFFLQRFCAQFVISRALEDSGLSWNTLKSTIGSVEALDQRLRPEDVLNAVSALSDSLFVARFDSVH